MPEEKKQGEKQVKFKHLYRPPAFANAFGVHPQTVLKAIIAGRIIPVYIGADEDAYIDMRRYKNFKFNLLKKPGGKMSHDIYAWPANSSSRLKGKAIAILSLNETQGPTTKFYSALDAHEFSKINSGSGDSKVFSQNEIRNALSEWWQSKLSPEETTFLATCMKHKQGVEILFE